MNIVLTVKRQRCLSSARERSEERKKHRKKNVIHSITSSRWVIWFHDSLLNYWLNMLVLFRNREKRKTKDVWAAMCMWPLRRSLFFMWPRPRPAKWSINVFYLADHFIQCACGNDRQTDGEREKEKAPLPVDCLNSNRYPNICACTRSGQKWWKIDRNCTCCCCCTSSFNLL